MSYPFLITLAILPSITWLLFYLRKDANPESNRMILKIFSFGMLVAIPAVFIQLGFFETSVLLPLSATLVVFLNTFVGVALTEEVLKYLVVKQKVMTSSELDEPPDIMLYMIIAALGFAALENILKFLSPAVLFLGLTETVVMSLFILFSSTFLHALVSGLFGFFLALSFFESKRRVLYFATGLFLATLLHGLYNFYIMTEDGYLRFAVPVVIIIGLAIFVSWGLRKLKKMKTVCKI